MDSYRTDTAGGTGRAGTARGGSALSSREENPRAGTAHPVYKEGHDTLGRIINNADEVGTLN